jgi:hypothetical protein
MGDKVNDGILRVDVLIVGGGPVVQHLPVYISPAVLIHHFAGRSGNCVPIETF